MFSAKQTPLGLLANGQETEVVPTAPPGVQPRWLPQRRQSAATPATCGFIDGSPTNIVSCRAGNLCVATGSYIGCCENTSSCSRIYTTCYDSSDSSCNASCSQDSSNLICISTLPYCVIYDYNSGAATGYGCGVTSGTVNVLYSATSPSATASATVVTTLEVTPTASTTGTPSTNSSSLSSGSIAGIVVGSIAAIVILLAVAIWLRRRRRSPNQSTTQGPGTGPGPKELPLSQNLGYRPIPPPSASDALSEYQPPSELEGGLSLPSSPDPRKGSNNTPMDTIAERNAVHELPGSVAERPELEPTVPGNRESQV
jgi:hypothetical protein